VTDVIVLQGLLVRRWHFHHALDYSLGWRKQKDCNVHRIRVRVLR